MKIKFTSKNQIYTFSNEHESQIENPFIEPDAVLINFRNQTLRIPFSMYCLNSKNVKVLINQINGELNFSKFNEISTVLIADQQIEVMEAMNNGWKYNEAEISWGNPDFKRAMNFFDQTADGLFFKETPFKQLAIDFVYNKVMIEGRPLKEKFQLVTAI